MSAAIATLAVLTVLWMLVVVGATVLDQSGAKILTALRGKSFAPSLATRPVRLRHQRYQPRALRSTQRQRAAA